MRKTYMIAAILLLSAVWMVAQTAPATPQSSSPQSTSPAATSPMQQPSTPDATQTSSESGASIEGCVGGSSGNFTLTDTSGKTWQLAGDTAKLADHVGHQVKITGSEAGKGDATSPSGAGASSGSTFTVKKVKMVSSSCPTGK